MAVALISLTVLDADFLPLENILIDSSYVNQVREQGTYRSVNYYDIYNGFATKILIVLMQ